MKKTTQPRAIAASENRKQSIGSSEIASVLGVCPYRSPYQLWNEKVNGSTFSGNKYTKAGTILEPAVIEFFRQATGAHTRYEDDVRFWHPNYSFITATPDRFYIRGKDGKAVRGLCEAKTTQINVQIEDEIPPSWFCQAQYQAMVYNAHQASNGSEMVTEVTIAWLVRGLDFHYAHFDVDADFGDMLLEKAQEFWHSYVLPKTPPEYETAEDVLHAYPKHIDGNVVEATDETVQAYESLIEIRERIKALEEEKAVIEDNFKKLMKDAEAITYFGSVLATWKATKPTRRLDTKRLKAEAPETYEQFLGEPKSTRRFLVKV